MLTLIACAIFLPPAVHYTARYWEGIVRQAVRRRRRRKAKIAEINRFLEWDSYLKGQ